MRAHAVSKTGKKYYIYKVILSGAEKKRTLSSAHKAKMAAGRAAARQIKALMGLTLGKPKSKLPARSLELLAYPVVGGRRTSPGAIPARLGGAGFERAMFMEGLGRPRSAGAKPRKMFDFRDEFAKMKGHGKYTRSKISPFTM